MKTVLVTGGCGFIGSHTVLLLLERGFRVYIIDSNTNSSPLVLERLSKILDSKKLNNFENLQFFKGDIRSEIDLENIFTYAQKKDEPIEAVIHFAGLKAVKESFQNPISYWDSNLSGTINLVKMMKKFSCKNFIFSSSATIYSNSKGDLLDENSLISPINPYGRTKAYIEIFLKDIFESDAEGWKIINLRYFNPIGAHESGELGEDPLGIPNNIFPLILNVAAKNIDKFKVFGNDWHTKDGTCIRDYIHVMDLADGHIAALSFLEKSNPFISSMNIGTGTGFSVLELINTFQEVNNVEVPYIFTNRREGDQGIVIADNKKILSVMGWRPNRTIKDMCRDGWKWKQLNPKGYC